MTLTTAILGFVYFLSIFFDPGGSMWSETGKVSYARVAGLVACAVGLFICSASASYTDSGWTQSTAIYLNTSNTGANVPGNVTDFPILIRLNGTDFDFSKSLVAGGGDVRFMKTNGSVLSYQIERWTDGSGTNDTADIWVKVDTVYGNNSTQLINMYLGKSGVTSQSNGAAVFDTAKGFNAVYHLALADTFGESSVNNWDAINHGTTNSAGAIGQGRLFSGSSQWLNLVGSGRGFIQNTRAMTLSAWVKPTAISSSYMGIAQISVKSTGIHNCHYDTTGYTCIRVDDPETGDSMYCNPHVTRDSSECTDTYGPPTSESRFFMSINPDGTIGVGAQAPDAGSSQVGTSTATISAGSWVYLTAVADVANDSIALYKDGQQVASTGTVAFTAEATDNTAPTSVAIGSQDDGSQFYFNGAIDEVVISKALRTADWIKLSFENQKASQALVGIGTPVVGVIASKSPSFNGRSGLTLSPMGASIKIGYTIPGSGAQNAVISIHNLQGKQVWKSIVDNSMTSGLHEQMWNGRNSQSQPVIRGVYVVKFSMFDIAKQRTVNLQRSLLYIP